MTRRTNGEGSVYRRATDGRWVGSLQHEDPVTGVVKRPTVYGDTRKAVVDKLKEIRGRLDQGKPARDDKMTLDRFAADLDHVLAAGQ